MTGSKTKGLTESGLMKRSQVVLEILRECVYIDIV
jgi:hypothetical protein